MPDKPKAGRPAKWSGPTTAIRVPEHLAAHLINIARQLDTPQAAEPSTTPEGLPICKPKADAETIAQGLAEGWIVPTAVPEPLTPIYDHGFKPGDRVVVARPNQFSGSLKGLQTTVSDAGPKHVSIALDRGRTWAINPSCLDSAAQ